MNFYPLTIEGMTICVKCWSDSRGHKYCYECSDRRSNACSIINQNKKKLAKLLTWRCSYDAEWIRKFSLYVDNIVKQLRILERFRIDERRFFEEKEDE